jgi:hypothetical protein
MPCYLQFIRYYNYEHHTSSRETARSTSLQLATRRSQRGNVKRKLLKREHRCPGSARCALASTKVLIMVTLISYFSSANDSRKKKTQLSHIRNSLPLSTIQAVTVNMGPKASSHLCEQVVQVSVVLTMSRVVWIGIDGPCEQDRPVCHPLLAPPTLRHRVQALGLSYRQGLGRNSSSSKATRLRLLLVPAPQPVELLSIRHACHSRCSRLFKRC